MKLKQKKGPLESLQMGDHCEMCGRTGWLEPAFDPAWNPRTLCRACRIGSAELLYVVYVKLAKAEGHGGAGCTILYPH
jgi:hypothetical protein